MISEERRDLKVQLGFNAAMTNTRGKVILIKAPIHSSHSDPYRQLFEQQGFEPVFLPVLLEVFDLHALEQVLSEGGHGYEGVVIMSRRGAEGWVKAASTLLPDEDDSRSTEDLANRQGLHEDHGMGVLSGSESDS